MNYERTMTAVFLSRPNRFLAHVLLDGKEVVCHVKNTGRLKELLNPGVPVVIQHHPDAKAAGRKTEYSLIAVASPVLGGSQWVNIDSQAPNQAAYEWLSAGDGLPFCPRPTDIRREVSHGGSRFDLAFSCQGQPWFMEVKGVTLNVNGQARFPDAPTERGIRHLHGLSDAVKEGFGAAVLFVLQMQDCASFTPNPDHPEFGEALRYAKDHGVHIWAWDCEVSEASMKIRQPVPVIL